MPSPQNSGQKLLESRSAFNKKKLLCSYCTTNSSGITNRCFSSEKEYVIKVRKDVDIVRHKRRVTRSWQWFPETEGTAASE